MAVVALLLGGCAYYTRTLFTAQADPLIYTGKGGTVTTVRGIDIWTVGDPNRRFKVLGTIEQIHYDNPSVMAKLSGTTQESELITLARQHGGDAVLLVNKRSVLVLQPAPLDANEQQPGGVDTKTNTRWAVVQYLP